MRAWILAIVDSGSPYCLFRDDVAAAIGIRDITTGKPFEFGSVKRGITGTAYFHKIGLYVESDWKIDVLAGFSSTLSVAGLLGRYGFFDHFLVAFDHSGNPPVMEISKIDRPA